MATNLYFFICFIGKLLYGYQPVEIICFINKLLYGYQPVFLYLFYQWTALWLPTCISWSVLSINYSMATNL